MKKIIVYIIRPRGLLHCQKKGVNSRTFFPVTKMGFIIPFSFFLFHPKWVDKVNLYGPKIKKGTISRVARRGNTHLFGLGGYVSLGYNVFWVLSLQKGPPAPLPMASLSAPLPPDDLHTLYSYQKYWIINSSSSCSSRILSLSGDPAILPS